MGLFVIADLHLSTNSETNKPMEVFGRRWTDHTEKIVKNWRAVVSDDDWVIIPGDISWALTVEEAESDLKLIDSLPGKKLLGKGNHDYWWTTAKKLHEFFDSNAITTLDILYNNAYECDDFIIAGTRGWYNDGSLKMPPGTDYDKLINRENERLRISLTKAKELAEASHKPILAFFHFPPVRGSFVCRKFVDTLKEFGVNRCYYGHIHGDYTGSRTSEFEDISFTLVSADFLDFHPLPIFI